MAVRSRGGHGGEGAGAALPTRLGVVAGGMWEFYLGMGQVKAEVSALRGFFIEEAREGTAMARGQKDIREREQQS